MHINLPRIRPELLPFSSIAEATAAYYEMVKALRDERQEVAVKLLNLNLGTGTRKELLVAVTAVAMDLAKVW